MNIETLKSLYEGKCSVTLEDPVAGSSISVTQYPGAVQVIATLQCMAAHLPFDRRVVTSVIYDECSSWEDVACCPIVAAVLQTL